MKTGKKLFRLLRMILLIVCLLMLVCYMHHRIRLSGEKDLRNPLGQMVEVNGNRMSVYIEGEGDKTLVFLSGGGTCSPILDFKSLYSLLRDEYRIAVVEKLGYGFSDVVDEERDIATILSETRQALRGAGVDGPYVLCPHSMSGIEALYWAQQYPGEVEAIIGLDMSVPDAYNDYQIHMGVIRLGQFAAEVGITRWIPGLSDGDAVRYGTLSEDEKKIYRAVFYSRTATGTMINEVKVIKDNAGIVRDGAVPQVPMLFFISNGQGTGWDMDSWQGFQKDYLQKVEKGQYRELACPHYVHNHEYEKINENIRSFLHGLE